jgi:hypothetical protein
VTFGLRSWIGREHLCAVDLGRPAGADGGGLLARHHLFDGGGVGEGGFDGSLREATLDEAAALTKGLRVDEDDLDVFRLRAGAHEQVVVDGDDDFVADGEGTGAVHEEIERLRYRTFEAVLDGRDPSSAIPESTAVTTAVIVAMGTSCAAGSYLSAASSLNVPGGPRKASL